MAGYWKEDASKLQEAKDRYETTVRALKERQARFEASSLPIEPLYTPLDTLNKPYLEDIGFPGEFPFSRGVYPTMYRGRPWTMRQYAGFGTAKETNARYRYLLSKGQTGLSVAFDLPTQMGYDSDHPLAKGEVGKVGVAIDTLFDMEVLFDGIPLGEVSTSMTINATAAILLAMYIAVGKKQGIATERLQGTIQNDILKEYIARGTYIFPPKPSLKIITDIFAFARDTCPKFNTISISGYHIREAGSTAAQEIAYTLLNGLAYVEAAIQAGLTIDSFAPRLSFFFNAHNALLEEIAKFRAARRLWARLIKERYAPKDPRSLMMRFHVQTAGSTLTAKQIENNVVRITIQALAAVLGGCQSLHTNSMDEALGLPSEASVKLALRTQQVIANETHLTDTIDPFGGSFAIEALTDALERKTRKLMREVEDRGSVLECIESGFIKRKIEESAYSYQRALEEKREIVVGMNAFEEEEDLKIAVFRVDPELERGQIERLSQIKASRGNSKVLEALERLSKTARAGENIMPSILEAVEAYASVGEISDTLRAVFGTYREQGA